LKGDLSSPFAVRHFTRNALYNISSETLIRLNGQRALVFLLRGPGGLYFHNLGGLGRCSRRLPPQLPN
jgi:hypothetical protein